MVRGDQFGNQKQPGQALNGCDQAAGAGSTPPNALAEKFLDLCAEGDMAALKELGDRLDGEARQQTELLGPDGQELGISVFVPARNPVDSDRPAG